MLNVSAVGRAATNDQRSAYHRWERTDGERARFAANIMQEFPGYEASVGGEISIDIVPKGWNKSVAKPEIENRHPNASIWFFGDRMGDGGNDQPLADALSADPRHAAIAVTSFGDTWNHLKNVGNAVAA